MDAEKIIRHGPDGLITDLGPLRVRLKHTTASEHEIRITEIVRLVSSSDFVNDDRVSESIRPAALHQEGIALCAELVTAER